MAEAIILFGGKVKNDSTLSNLTFNNKSGFVGSFTFGGAKYTHAFSKNYLNDPTKPAIEAGYYEEQQFLQYLAKQTGPEKLKVLSLDMIADAVAGDTIRISKLKVTAPYTDFCKINSYFWTYDPLLEVVDQAGNIIIRATTDPSVVNVPLSETAYAFFNHNIPLITNIDFQDNKDEAAYSLALIALQVHRINRDIFPLFSKSPELNTYIDVQNNEWATGTIFTLPTYEDILQYEESITNYYNSAYSNQLLIYNSPKKTQLFWLAIVMTASGLAALPIDLKLTMIKETLDYMNLNYAEDNPYSPFQDIVSDAPDVLAKIAESVTVTPAQTDYFLDKLNELVYVDNGRNITLFEAMYKNLGDNRTGRLTFGAINRPNYRGMFVSSLYTIWKNSKYYPYYNSPDYTQPANETTMVYPESYYILHKATAYNKTTAPMVITYASSSTELIDYYVGFTFEIESQKILAYKVEEETIRDEHASTATFSTLYGTYAFYQPVSLIGYQQDPSIIVPSIKCIPLFYLLYVYDYKQERKADSLLLNGIEFAVTFALFGPLSELSYLTEISEIAESAALPAERVLLQWEIAGSVSRLVQFTAGAFNAIKNYVSENSEDPQLKEFCKELDQFLSFVALGAMGFDLVAQSRLIASAARVAAHAEELGEAVNLDKSVIEEVAYIADINELEGLVRTKLAGLPLSNNRLLAKFNSLATDEERLAFFNDFYFLEDNDIGWFSLNDTFDVTVNGTTSSYSLVDIWSSDIKVLMTQRKNVSFLLEYKYIIYTEGSVWEHIYLIKNSSRFGGNNFNPIGGHTFDNFLEIHSLTDLDNLDLENKFLIIDPKTPGLPENMRDYDFADLGNGHTRHKNVYVYNPNERVGNGTTYKIDQRVFKRIELKDELNFEWTEDRLKEEHAFALSNKKYLRTRRFSSKFGQSDPQIIEYYESHFSDNTPVIIWKANYEWQYNRLFRDYISYIGINKL